MTSDYRLAFPKTARSLFLLCAATAIAMPAQTLTTLASFDGTNGSQPEYVSLVQGLSGSLFGPTSGGGAYSNGTIFKITKEGSLTTVYSFPEVAGIEGVLMPTVKGTFYGTTQGGGTYGYGTVFILTPGGRLTTLHNFMGGTDGFNPEGGLVQGSDGDLYGTTFQGGAYTYYGTVFRMTRIGVLTTLYSFNDADGSGPQGGLVQGSDGDFYGTTMNGLGFWGTVFKITPKGKLTTLHSFCTSVGCSDGSQPQGGLVQGTDGNLYGTTLGGGTYDQGTVYKITPGGKFKTIYSFCGQNNCPDGAGPAAGVVQGTDGNFYGTTFQGGANFQGTVFKVTPDGTETVLHSFCSENGCPDGQYPTGGLVQATSGTFYGTTYFGGSDDKGTVFSLDVGLGPFITTLPTSGTVGSAVKILGTDLTGATSVTFNGVAATFTVVQPSEITTTVPTGATTGKVEGETPTGTLLSNVAFRVP